jgi:hypothetical protein
MQALIQNSGSSSDPPDRERRTVATRTLLKFHDVGSRDIAGIETSEI